MKRSRERLVWRDGGDVLQEITTGVAVGRKSWLDEGLIGMQNLLRSSDI